MVVAAVKVNVVLHGNQKDAGPFYYLNENNSLPVKKMGVVLDGTSSRKMYDVTLLCFSSHLRGRIMLT